MELPFLVKTCDLFVYLNLHFRSFQFEEVISTFVANIHQRLLSGKKVSGSGLAYVGRGLMKGPNCWNLVGLRAVCG